MREELSNCKKGVGQIESSNVIDLSSQTLEAFVRDCGSIPELAKIKADVESIKQEVKEQILSICQALDDIYRTVLVLVQKLDVYPPLAPYYQDTGVSNILMASENSGSHVPGFFTKFVLSFTKYFDQSFSSSKRNFLVAVLGYTGSMSEIGKDMVNQDWLTESGYYDFRKATKEAEAYFDGIDFTKDEYGYSLTSLVPEDVKQTIRDDIKPNAPTQAATLDLELKKWEGDLTDKQKLVLGAIRFLGTSFRESLLHLPGEFAAVNNRLQAITDGAVQAVKDVTKCLAKIGVSGDFADWYEIYYGLDYCSGDKIGTSGRVLSAAGLVVGSSKFWRIIGESVGISSTVKHVAQETADFAESVRDLKFEKEELSRLAHSDQGQVLAKIKVSAAAKDENGYKIFRKGSSIGNSLPENGLFVRVMPRKYAVELKEGRGNFSRIFVDPEKGTLVNEAFITAADDVSGLKNGRDVAEKLGLFEDESGTILRKIGKKVDPDMSEVLVTFKFKDEIYSSIRSPIETPDNLRKYGFLPGGKTIGGAREWLIDSDAISKGYVDISSLSIRDLE